MLSFSEGVSSQGYTEVPDKTQKHISGQEDDWASGAPEGSDIHETLGDFTDCSAQAFSEIIENICLQSFVW